MKTLSTHHRSIQPDNLQNGEFRRPNCWQYPTKECLVRMSLVWGKPCADVGESNSENIGRTTHPLASCGAQTTVAIAFDSTKRPKMR